MHERITRVIDRAARRLRLVALVGDAAPACAMAAGVAVVLACIDRFPGGPYIDWYVAGPALLLGCVLALLVRRVTRPLTRHDAAVVLDDRLDQHDLFSSALAVAHRGGEPIPSVLLQRAAQAAAAPDLRSRMVSAMPLPRSVQWWWTPGLAALAVGLSMFGQIPGGSGGAPVASLDLQEARMDTDEAVAAMQRAIDRSPEISAQLGDEALFGTHDDLDDPEAVRRETLRDLSSLARRLEQLQSGPAVREMEQAAAALRSMPQVDGDDPTADVRRAMSQGDMEALAEAIAAMQDKATGDADSTAAREALAEDVRQAAADNEALDSAMRQAGIDPALAKDPEALDKALEASDQLSDQQKKDLEQLAKDSAASRKTLGELARDIGGLKMVPQKGPDDDGDASDKPPSAAERLAQCQKMKRQASQCQGACQTACRSAGSGLATNRAGKQGRKSGEGTQTGQGQGGALQPVEEDDAAAEVAVHAGGSVDTSATVVASGQVQAPLEPGQARATAAAPVEAARRRLEQGLDTRSIGRRYREAVAAWFADAADLADAAESDATRSKAAQFDESHESSEKADDPEGKEPAP